MTTVKNKNIYNINSDDIRKGLEGLNKVQTNRFSPDHIVVLTGEIEHKEVPIVPAVQINISEGYTLVGDIIVEPPTTTVSGNGRILEGLNNLKTENTFFENGIVPEISQFDNHGVHIDEHIRYVLQMKYQILKMKKPEYAKMLEAHISQHRQSTQPE